MSVLDSLVTDIGYALRSCRRAPIFALVALVTLSLGIACVTTVFSIINTTALRPLPYPEARRTVALADIHGRVWGYSAVSPAVGRALRADMRSFDYVGLYDVRQLTLQRAAGASELVDAAAVDTAIFPMLAIAPERGRALDRDEILRGAPVLVIGDALWRSEFGGDSRLIGSTVRIADALYTIVGVMPPQFSFPVRAQAWIPLRETVDSADRMADLTYESIARLRPGTSRSQARAELATVAARLAREDPAHFARLTIAMRDEMVDRGTAVALRFGSVFLAAAVLVLLVACSNVGSLYLIRAAERRGEMAVRASLGASRGRLIRQNLTESLVLATAAGALGAVLSVWGVKVVLSIVPTQGFPRWMQFGVDMRVLAFTFGTSLVATAAFGLLPAREGTRVDLVRALKAGGDTSTGGSRRHGGSRGIALQLALACALLVVSVLFWRSYAVMAGIDRGYDSDHVLQAWLSLDSDRYPDALARAAFVDDVMGRIAQRPGVSGIAVRGVARGWLDSVPEQRRGSRQHTVSTNERDYQIFLPGQLARSPEADMFPRVQHLAVSPSYFDVMKIPLLRGRGFTSADGQGAAYVGIASRRLAAELWPRGDALGRLLKLGARGPLVEIVGVAADTRGLMTGMHDGQRESTMDAQPILYLPARQAGGAEQLLVRSEGNPALLAAGVRSVVSDADPSVAASTRTLREDVHADELVPELIGGTFGAFAICALVLALIGTYGVIGYDIRQRGREIGIRLALGGTTGDIVTLIVGKAMRHAGAGLLLGAGLAIVLAQGVRFMLVGVSSVDARVYLSTVACLGGVALLACWLPARRVARVDPAVALRAE